jgi:hypothetical protein
MAHDPNDPDQQRPLLDYAINRLDPKSLHQTGELYLFLHRE